MAARGQVISGAVKGGLINQYPRLAEGSEMDAGRGRLIPRRGGEKSPLGDVDVSIMIFTDLHVIYRIIWGYLGSKLGNYPNFLGVGLDPKDRKLSETCTFLTRTCLSCSCKILKFLRPVRWQGLKDVWV